MKRSINTKELVHYPLCDAVINDDMDSLDAILASGADVDGTDYNGLTALFYAAEWGRVAMAEKLLIKGANIEFRDSYGNTPLKKAVYWVFKYGIEMIDLLISYGADINAKNNNGVTPKSLSKRIAGFPEIEAFKD